MTGIDRSQLHKLKKSGKIPGNINSSGKIYYTVTDFSNNEVIDRMKKKGLSVSDAIQKLSTAEIAKPIKSAKVLPFTTNKKIEKLPSGLVTKYIKPLSSMTSEAREIWDFTLPDLISQESIHKADLYTLKNYCMTQSQITDMENVLKSEGCFFEGRVNPLIGAVDKARNSAKILAVALQITALGRKGMPIKGSDSGDDAAWDKVLK